MLDTQWWWGMAKIKSGYNKAVLRGDVCWSLVSTVQSAFGKNTPFTCTGT